MSFWQSRIRYRFPIPIDNNRLKRKDLSVRLISISDRNRKRLIYRLLSIAFDCYQKRISLFYMLSIPIVYYRLLSSLSINKNR